MDHHQATSKTSLIGSIFVREFILKHTNSGVRMNVTDKFQHQKEIALPGYSGITSSPCASTGTNIYINKGIHMLLMMVP